MNKKCMETFLFIIFTLKTWHVIPIPAPSVGTLGEVERG